MSMIIRRTGGMAWCAAGVVSHDAAAAAAHHNRRDLPIGPVEEVRLVQIEFNRSACRDGGVIARALGGATLLQAVELAHVLV